MESTRIDVIATTISGSIKDWGKTKKIVPLFRTHGWEDVSLHEADSHPEARKLTRDLVRRGSRVIISAGGSGTFNSVLEGCLDAGVGLAGITLGFLRKGSADLIGKTLGMPDDVESAVNVFVESLAAHRTVKCDVIQAVSGAAGTVPRHFVGYGGAEIFGRIPHFTENRFIKYYKGVLGQLFGDLGPFFVGASLSVMEKSFQRALGKRRMPWKIYVDGQEASRGYYQAMIIVNGYLGPDLPFARSVPLGSGDFYIFTMRDLGLAKILSQFRHAWDSSIMKRPEHWGFESFCVKKELKIENDTERLFPVNVDGSTLNCRHRVTFRIVDQVSLLSKN